MRYLFLFVALLLATNPAVAQGSLTTAQLDTLVATQAAPDTAAAIHRLFVAKRRVIRYAASGTLLAAVAAIIVVTNAEAGFIDTRGVAASGIGLIGGAALLGETLSYIDWSRKKERLALEAWQQHRLSAFYHRKLKAKYFR